MNTLNSLCVHEYKSMHYACHSPNPRNYAISSTTSVMVIRFSSGKPLFVTLDTIAVQFRG